MVANTEPPDGGWGWVIVICGFINHMFTVGLMMSLSVFYVSWLDQFGESKGSTSWIVSIGVACMFGLCPIPAALAVRFGFRIVAFIGAVLTTSGLVLSVFATSVTYLVISIGLITGVGCCFSYLPAMATVAMYFDKRRSLAMGLNTAGTGAGAFVLAPLLNLLEEKYGWRGAILLLGGITLHMCVTSMLMRDTEAKWGDQTTVDTLECDKDKQRKEANDGLTKDKATADLAMSPMIKIMCENDNDIEGHASLKELQFSSESKQEDSVVDEIDCLEIDVQEHDLGMDESLRNVLFLSPHNAAHNLPASDVDLRKNLILENKNLYSCSLPNLDTRTLERKWSHRSITKSIQNMDLALLASMPSILNEKEQLETNFCHHPDDPINKTTAGIREDLGKFSGERNFVSMILSSKVIKENLELFSDKAHVAFCVSNFITNLSFITPVVFMVDRAVYQGINKSTAAILISANGVGSIAGRVIFGYIANHFPTRHMCMYTTVLIVCGVGTMLSDLCGNFVVLHAAYASFFGFLIGTYIVLAPIVTLDLTNVTVFATAYGQVLFFMGIATIFGPPFAGWLFDWTRSYLLSYLAIGFFLVVSGVMLLPLLCKDNKVPSTTTREHSDVLRERANESRLII